MTTSFSRAWEVETQLGTAHVCSRELSDADLKAVIQPFKKEPGMSWANPPGTIWITLTIAGNSAGVCALGRDGRCKSDVVLERFRGFGLYGVLSKARIDLARELKLSGLSAFAGPMSIGQFLKDGFLKSGDVNKHGIQYLRKALTN